MTNVGDDCGEKSKACDENRKEEQTHEAEYPTKI
jgi:hypothetical protein